MSTQAPIGDESGAILAGTGSSGGPSVRSGRSRVRPSTRLLGSKSRLSLFCILKKAWKHLDSELCPREPKSVRQKATDVLRNVPHWQRHVKTLRIRGSAAVDLRREEEACDRILEAAKESNQRLGELVDKEDVRAENECQVLTGILRWALEYIGGEFHCIGEPPSSSGKKAVRTKPVQ